MVKCQQILCHEHWNSCWNVSWCWFSERGKLLLHEQRDSGCFSHSVYQTHCKVSCASELRVYMYQVWLAFIHLGGTLSQFCTLCCLKDLLAQHTAVPGNAVSPLRLFQNLNCKICTYHSQYIHNVHNTQV